MLPSLSVLFGQDKDVNNSIHNRENDGLMNSSSINNLTTPPHNPLLTNTVQHTPNSRIFINQQHHHDDVNNVSSHGGVSKSTTIQNQNSTCPSTLINDGEVVDERTCLFPNKQQQHGSNYHQFIPSLSTIDVPQRASHTNNNNSNSFDTSSNLNTSMTQHVISMSAPTSKTITHGNNYSAPGLIHSTSTKSASNMVQYSHQQHLPTDHVQHEYTMTKDEQHKDGIPTRTSMSSSLNTNARTVSKVDMLGPTPNNTIDRPTNTSQQRYFSNPTSIAHYSSPLIPNKFNLSNASNLFSPNNDNSGNVTSNTNNTHQIQSIHESIRLSYERTSPVLLKSDVQYNVPPSSSSTMIHDPSSNVFNNLQIAPKPSHYENINQQHELDSSTHSFIKDNTLINVNNGIFYEDADFSKRKLEEPSNSSTKKRKTDSLQKSNNSENVINPPPPIINTAQSSLNRPSTTLNNSKKTKRSLKSPSSDNSLSNTTNNYTTSNTISTTPNINSIQFMNFSISDKSKIKFVNARHQQIGINDGAWTEKEHQDFMRGLNECGRGRWREIAENYVLTRTRTQVASHARKYLDSPIDNKK